MPIRSSPVASSVRRMRGLLLLVLLPALLALTVLTPPFWVADEPPHYMRANGLSHGAILPVRTRGFDGRPAAGGPVDAGFMTFFTAVLRALPTSERPTASAAEVRRVLHVHYPDWPAAAPYSNTAIYPPILYLPAAGAIGAARLVGATQLAGFYAGRIANVLAAVAVLYVLLGRAGRLAPFVIGCASAPIVLFGTASLSADALLIPLAVSFSCLLARIPSQRPEHRPLALGAATVLLTVGKIAYVPLAVAPLAAAAWFDRRWTPRVRFLAGAAAIAVACWAAWAYAVHRDVFSIRPGVTIDPAGQLRWIVQHPGRFARIAARQLVADREALTFGVFGHRLGWGYVVLPRWTSIVAAAALVVAGCGVETDGERPWPLFAAFAGLATACAAGIVLLLYLQFNAVGAISIEGIQGRYLLPLIIFAAPWLSRPRRAPRLVWAEAAAALSAASGAFALLHAGPGWWAA